MIIAVLWPGTAAARPRTLVVSASSAAVPPTTATTAARHPAAAATSPGPAPFSTIQAAVDRARPGDWIVITAGVYHGSVLVRTPSIHIRGVDRNKTILDGQHRIGNGIEVRADHVSVENLTVRDFDRRPGTSTGGNQIFWNGGLGSGHVGLRGWTGRFLTAYDTGLAGANGVVVSNATVGSLDHVYASGLSGAGVFIGACRDCWARIQHVTAENNAIGFSGANAGGHLVVEHSIFRSNAMGIAPFSLATAALPPPQDGSCYAAGNRAATPLVATTRLSRCTVVRDNLAQSNNNMSAPAGAAVGPHLWGVGIAWPGLYADAVENNIVQGNANFGILAFEAPDPYPPAKPSVYFQVAGNAFTANTATLNGVLTGGADLALEGGAFGRGSVDNCFAGNHFASSIPDRLESTWGCKNATTPIGTPALAERIRALAAPSAARRPAPQPAPGPQIPLTHPCAGPPPSAVCR